MRLNRHWPLAGAGSHVNAQPAVVVQFGSAPGVDSLGHHWITGTLRAWDRLWAAAAMLTGVPGVHIGKRASEPRQGERLVESLAVPNGMVIRNLGGIMNSVSGPRD